MKLFLRLVLFFTLLISLFLLLCKVLLNQLTRAQVWGELVLLRNCLSCPSRLALRALIWLPHTAWDDARKPHLFQLQIQTHRMSEISPFKLLNATALFVHHCFQSWFRLDVFCPTTGLLTHISTGTTESLSKQKQ